MPIPEPTTLLLLSIGLLGVGTAARKKRRAKRVAVAEKICWECPLLAGGEQEEVASQTRAGGDRMGVRTRRIPGPLSDNGLTGQAVAATFSRVVLWKRESRIQIPEPAANSTVLYRRHDREC
jgi:hypothetical protein